MDWAKSDVSSFDVVLYLSSLHKKTTLPLTKLVWGEFADLIEENSSKQIFQELRKMKEKILIVIDALGKKIQYKLCIMFADV